MPRFISLHVEYLELTSLTHPRVLSDGFPLLFFFHVFLFACCSTIANNLFSSHSVRSLLDAVAGASIGLRRGEEARKLTVSVVSWISTRKDPIMVENGVKAICRQRGVVFFSPFWSAQNG